MCCFGIRVFLLFFITILSFILHRLYPQVAVVFYYLLLANILGFIMIGLYFTNRLPKFVKENSMHYFALIGGFIGSFAAMGLTKKFSPKFMGIQIVLAIFWIIFMVFLIINFKEISGFFSEFII